MAYASRSLVPAPGVGGPAAARSWRDRRRVHPAATKPNALVETPGSVRGKDVQPDRPAGGAASACSGLNQRPCRCRGLPGRQQGDVDEQDFCCAAIGHDPADGSDALPRGENNLGDGGGKLQAIRLLLGAKLQLQKAAACAASHCPSASSRRAWRRRAHREILIVRSGRPQGDHGRDHAGLAAAAAAAGSAAGSSTSRTHLRMWG